MDDADAVRPFREHGILALDLANTWDSYLHDPERVPDLAALWSFLAELDVEGEPRASDLTAFRSLRDELRAILGAPDEGALVARLDELAGGVRATPAISTVAPGRWRLSLRASPKAPLAERLAVRSIAELAELVEDPGPERIRTCDADPCTDAFVDRSRNGTRRYCSRRCANRRNAALHRARST